MKPLILIGVVLIVLGLFGLSYQGMVWLTTRDTVVQAGPVTVQAERQHPVPVAPILGGACIAGGAVLLLIAGTRRNQV